MKDYIITRPIGEYELAKHSDWFWLSATLEQELIFQGTQKFKAKIEEKEASRTLNLKAKESFE